MRPTLRLIAVLGCSLMVLGLGSSSANASVISSNEDQTNRALTDDTRIAIVAWHLTPSEFTDWSPSRYTKPLIVSDDTKQVPTTADTVRSWMEKIRRENLKGSNLGWFHYEHLDTDTLPSMRAQPNVMYEDDSEWKGFSGKSTAALGAIKAVVDGNTAFKQAVKLPSNPCLRPASGGVLTVWDDGRPLVLVGFSGYGTMISDKWSSHFGYFFNTLEANNVNFTRVFVVDMYTAANRKGENQPPAVQWADKGAVPFRKVSTENGPRYDLNTLDDDENRSGDFFDRLTKFVSIASSKGIVVQISLFTSWDTCIDIFGTWHESPYRYRSAAWGNNKNGFLRDAARTEFDSSADVAGVNAALVSRIVAKLSSYRNVIFEIINEPVACGSRFSLGWQRGIVDQVAAQYTSQCQ